MDHSAVLSVRPSQLTAALSFLSEDEIACIWRCAETEAIQQGRDLYTPEGIADCFYLILEGRLAVKKPAEFGHKSQLIALLDKHAAVGEAGIAGQRARTVTITATENTVLLRLSRESFDKLQIEQPQLAIKLLKQLLTISSRRLEKCSERLSRVL